MAGRASIKFFHFQDPNKAGVQPIYLRITYNRKKAELHAGVTCTHRIWK
jgi:hypothetical protein